MSLIDFGDSFLEEPLNFSIKQINNCPEDEIVCLHIARFSKVPKLDFSKVHVNKSKVLELFIRNSNDYPVVIYIDKPTKSEFSLELNEVDLEDEGNRDPESPDIVMGLEPSESRSIFVRWSPTTTGNVRETLNIKWEGGSKLHVVFLGSAIGIPKKNKVSQTSKNRSITNQNAKKTLKKSPIRNVLGSIQSETPSRRTTFSVSNPEKSTTDNLKSPDKENTNYENSMKSCSPLSFEKLKPPQPNRFSKSNLTIPKTQNHSNHTQQKAVPESRRQTYSIPKKAQPNRNLFGDGKAKGQITTKKSGSTTGEIENKENEKPKPFLRRKSVSQIIPKPSMQKGIAMRKLKLVKGPKTSMPRHPMPFAAKNMFYDERWIDKQERGFANWLNYILTPEDENSTASSDQDVVDRRGTFTVDAGRKQPVAPTREDLSFRAYSIRRRMAQLRRAACLMYQSEQFMFVIHKVEKEIECGLLAVRLEKHILADLGIKNQILKMLLSYNSLWLRIGLEVIYGEVIPLHSNNDITNISKFITHRLLANPDIATEYSHPSVPNLFKPGYEEALSKFALKKFLLLVLFLDHAKRNRLVTHDPCLFNKESNVKASRDILLMFARDFLKGEGDITKHLSYMGITIAHSQTVLDEYDFGVKNIAVDLRDGVRLIRVVELLTENWSLSSKVRLPAISRLQKVHNVGVALDCLKSHGLSLTHDAKCVVDGHREKTLILLWQMIFHFQVGMLLDVQKLKEEVGYLKMRLKLREDMTAIENNTHFLDLTRQQQNAGSYGGGGGGSCGGQISDDQLYFKSDKLSLLLQWCRSVCSYYDVKIENFTVSFSDGIAFCCLVNFYHPDILPKSLINHETTQTCSVSQQEEGEEDDFFYDNWTKCFSPNTGINRRLETLLSNEKENYQVLNEAIHELGGIPSLLRVGDMSNTIPDEKVVITYVSYLCSRLLSIQKETRAARRIQLAWRRYKLTEHKDTLQVKHDAACKIQKCFRGYLARMNYLFDRECVIICQSVARRWLVYRDMEVQHAAAYIIQSVYRGHLETSQLRYRFLQMRASVIIIQRAFRDHLFHQVQMYMGAASLIQAYWKGYRERIRYKKVKSSAVVVQKTWRMYKIRVAFLKNRENQIQMDAASIIQAHWKGYREKIRYNQVKCHVVAIQKTWRKYKLRSDYTKTRSACLCIQRYYRAWMCKMQTRCEYLSKRDSTMKIQRFFRNYRLTKEMRTCFLTTRSASIQIQAWFRMLNTKNTFKKKKAAAMVIQKLYRSYLTAKEQRLKYLELRHASLTLQSHFRRYLVQKSIRIQVESAVVIQSHFRRHLVRKSLRIQTDAAILIQRLWRCSKKRDALMSRYSQVKRCCIFLQSMYRMKPCRNLFLRQQRAAVVIQRKYRAMVTRREEMLVRKTEQSIIKIQSTFRQYSTRKRFLTQCAAALSIQKRWRAYCTGNYVRKTYSTLREATIVLQSCYRMKRARSAYLSKRRFAIKIQASFRMFLCRKSYLRLKQAIIVLQANSRRKKAGKSYAEKRDAVLRLQQWCRVLQCRRKLLEQRNACVKIQSFIRAALQHHRFVQQKEAAVLIQCCYRGYKNRNDYQQMQSACIKLQAVVRGHFTRLRFQKQRSAAVKIQTLYRTYTTRRKYFNALRAVIMMQSFIRMSLSQNRFHGIQKAVIRIQSIYRMHTARTRYLEIQKSVLKLQSYCKMRVIRKSYLEQKKSALKLQAFYRAYCSRKLFQRQKDAALIIQTNYRSYFARQSYLNKKIASTKIQSVVKMYLSKLAYKKKKEAVLTLQSCVPSYLIKKQNLVENAAALKIQSCYKMHQEVIVYRKKRQAVLKVQSSFRRYLAGKYYNQLQRSAVVLQSYFRMYSAKQKYDEAKIASLKIQSFVRMYNLRTEYLNKRKAAVTVQSVFRGSRIRAKYRETLLSICKIQSCVRMFSERSHYLVLKGSALKIQAFYRMCKVRRAMKERSDAAVKIQTAYRGYCARKDFIVKKYTTIYLQSLVRMRLCKTRYDKQRNDVVKLQSLFRMRYHQNTYNNKKHAVLKLQTFYRMHKQREYFESKKSVTIKVQSFIRMFIVRNEYLKLVKSAKLIQSAWRAYTKRRAELQAHAELVRTVVRLQAFVRMRHCRREYVKTRNAVVTLQSHVRCFQQRRRYKSDRKAIIRLQSYTRMVLARMAYLNRRRAAIKLQSFYRMHQARLLYLKMVSAANTIARFWKAHREKKEYERYVVVIQSFCRMVLTMLAYKKQYNTVVWLQSTARMLKAQHQFVQTRKSIITLQTWWRMVSCKRAFKNKIQAATLIQSVYRGRIARMEYLRRLERIRMKETQAVVRIQSIYRMYKVRKQYLEVKNACVRIQRSYRAHTKVSPDYLRYHIIRGGVITIQAHIRGYLSRLRYKKTVQSTIVIQSFVRMYQQRRSYQEKIVSAVTVQKNVRGFLARKAYKGILRNIVYIQTWYKNSISRKKEFQRQQCAALVIQGIFKIAVAKRQFRSMIGEMKNRHKAAIQIQALWRKHKEQARYQRILKATCKIQAFMREMLSKRTYMRRRQAAVTIQRFSRAKKWRKVLMNHLRVLIVRKKAVGIIEKRYYGYLQMKQQRYEYLQTRRLIVGLQRRVKTNLCNLSTRRREKAVIAIQKAYRFYKKQKLEKALVAKRQESLHEFIEAGRKCLAVLKIQRWFRWLVTYREEKRKRRIEESAIKIQCLWRGYFVRRRIKDKRLKKALQRIDIANNNVTEPMKLCNRTRSALDYLLKVKNLSTVYDALRQLDIATSLSFQCCERLVQDNALPVIYRIINYGNRSLPWISIKQVAFSILLSLAKCQSTYRAVYEVENSMDNVLEQMANFRDKRVLIFPMACNLLTVLCHDDVIKKDFQKRVKRMEKIRTFLKLSERKQKMETQRSKVNKQLHQEKEQQFSKTTWHRRASFINSKDPHLSIQTLAKALALR